MDKIDWLLIIIFLAGIILSFSIGRNYPNKKEVIVEKDTVYVNITDSSSTIKLDSLYNTIDSIKKVNMEYFTELTIATIKLERIKDYNEIAAKGNNIKYLRGWINRVMND